MSAAAAAAAILWLTTSITWSRWMESFESVSAVYPRRAIIADNTIDLTTHDSITGASARRLDSTRLGLLSAASIPFAVLTLLHHSVIIVSCYSTRVIEFARQPYFHFNGIGRRVERTVKWNELPTLSDYCSVKSNSKKLFIQVAYQRYVIFCGHCTAIRSFSSHPGSRDTTEISFAAK